MKTILFSFMLIIFIQLPLVAQTTVSEEYQLANKAYKAKNYPEFLSHLKKANELRPNHRTILYNLAVAYTLNNQYKRAINTLAYRASFYAVNDFSEDADFNSLKELEGYSQLLSQIEEQNKPILNSTLHFEFIEQGFHPEGIAIQPKTEDFFISDVRCGRIYSFDKSGSSMRKFIDLKELGFWGAMGMAFDKLEQNILWVTTSALPQFCEYTDSLEGKSAVLKIDVAANEILQSYSVEGNHVFGDLIISENGTVYITDSADPIVYRINKDSNSLEVFLEPEGLFNLQGLALADENTLYLSDYITGVYHVDFSDKSLTPVLSENQLTRGTDGLYFQNNQLYLLQNGTMPFQVARINLDTNSIEILDVAVPELNEPTLGVINHNSLFFIANSPWAFYYETGNPMFDEWPTLQIRKLKIDKELRFKSK